MKRSTILYGILVVMFVAVLISGFTVSQDVLDNYEVVFLWIVMPLMGLLWIRAYIDAAKGK